MKTLAALALALVASTAYAKDLDPIEAAKIEREQESATKKVYAEHGNKQDSEMSPEEKRQVIEEQQKARLEVLDRHGVSDKDYARYQGKLGPEQREQQKAAAQALDRQAAAEKTKPAADPNAAKPADEVVVQRGGDTAQAVDLETGKPLPTVDRGMPTVERGQPTASSKKASRPHSASRSHHHSHHRR